MSISVNDNLFNNLHNFEGFSINEKIYNYLGNLGFTGSIDDRLGKFESALGDKGLRGFIQDFGSWTPRQLFQGGQQGIFYHPRPIVSGQQILYQDSAGTTPVTADGDPVGYMRDLSGNGNHATQATSAARPLYRTDGTLHWLEPDGVDDYMLAGDGFNIADFTVFAAVGPGSGTNQRLFDTRGTGGVGDAKGWQLKPYTGGSVDGFVVDEQNGVTNDSLPFDETLVDKIVTASFDRASDMLIREDGVLTQTKDPTMNDVVSQQVSCLFANSNGQTTQLFNGKFFGGVVVQGVPSFDNPEQYIAKLAGIQL